MTTLGCKLSERPWLQYCGTQGRATESEEEASVRDNSPGLSSVLHSLMHTCMCTSTRMNTHMHEYTHAHV